MPLVAREIEDIFTCEEKGVKKLLSSILTLNLQHETHEKAIVSEINRLLSVAKRRKEGLEYLSLIINSCSSDAVADNGLIWINHCIVKFPDDVLREMKLRVLGRIIEVAHDRGDFNKKFVSDYISKVVDNCITTLYVNIYECKTALTTLATCMKYYFSWFGQQKPKIEKFILIFLDSEDIELVEKAAIALHYLQSCGAAGVSGVNHKTNFTQTFHKLCRTAHQLYDKFFENESEYFTSGEYEGDAFEFEDNPTHSVQSVLHSTGRRILNVYKFIEIAIKLKYPVAKETRPNELLALILRALSFHKCISGNNEVPLQTYQFSLELLEIQCAALKLLRLFIIWFQSNSLPFSYTISKTIVDSIERTHNCNCYLIDCLYSEAAYRALYEWISISKSSLHPNFQSHILECVLLSITPVAQQVTLTITDAATGKKSQKAKRKAMVNRIVSSEKTTEGLVSTTKLGKNSAKTTCYFALKVLKRLLDCTTLNVKADLLMDLHKSVLDTLLDIQSGKPSDLYTDPRCQANLYEILVGFLHQNTVPVVVSLHTALNILTKGSNHQDHVVADICQEGLRISEKLCQPICPSLFMRMNTDLDDAEEDVAENHAAHGEEMETSQDLSASMEEASKPSELHNDSVDRNSTSESIAYNVRYTESDRSTIDDGLSEKGEQTDNVMFEEMNVDAEVEFKHDEEISQHPVVTAPSEDGNEILEGQQIQDDEMEPIAEEPESESIANVEDSIESERSTQPAEEQSLKTDAVDEVGPTPEISTESEQAQIMSADAPSETIREDPIATANAAAVIQSTEVVIEGDLKDLSADVEEGRKRKTSENEKALEPIKKLKASETGVHESSIEGGKWEDALDATYLEDDSFVDEVRNDH
ncbi:hypothetical protein HUJ04_004452 [Dendroctonus ponderosae]|uniref:Pre-rRNA-processing protein RIX1 N-terminal domain-containing protein n=2 Tax=Dendroctonus ponderosae TaxID=77166 RepID=A0AAR5PA92_DENPD|nr:hypothetical protein HUJ04_004452 [Dendroctonus ponderosae]